MVGNEGKMRRVFAICLMCLVLSGMLAGCTKEENGPLSGKHHVEIELEDYGVIKAELDADAAPITVTNVLSFQECLQDVRKKKMDRCPENIMWKLNWKIMV